MTPLFIPPDHVEVFTKLTELDESDFAQLASVIDNAEPSLSVDALISDLDSSNAPIDTPAARALLAATFSFATACRSESWDLDEALEALAASSQLDMDETQRSVLQQRVGYILKADSVAVMHKALVLSSAHDRLFRSAESMTDIRPLFGGALDGPLIGALISHDLRFDVTSQGKSETISITLDDNDVAELKKVLDRAQEKSATTKRMLDATGVTHVDWRNDDDS